MPASDMTLRRMIAMSIFDFILRCFSMNVSVMMMSASGKSKPVRLGDRGRSVWTVSKTECQKAGTTCIMLSNTDIRRRVIVFCLAHFKEPLTKLIMVVFLRRQTGYAALRLNRAIAVRPIIA
jgi:hypothetical protein